jgi:hypothetical protein
MGSRGANRLKGVANSVAVVQIEVPQVVILDMQRALGRERRRISAPNIRNGSRLIDRVAPII